MLGLHALNARRVLTYPYGPRPAPLPLLASQLWPRPHPPAPALPSSRTGPLPVLTPGSAFCSIAPPHLTTPPLPYSTFSSEAAPTFSPQSPENAGLLLAALLTPAGYRARPSAPPRPARPARDWPRPHPCPRPSVSSPKAPGPWLPVRRGTKPPFDAKQAFDLTVRVSFAGLSIQQKEARLYPGDHLWRL